MGVIRETSIPCSHCGERTWYVREPEEKRVTHGTLAALALVPLRILDSALGVLSERPTRSHQQRVDEGLMSAALRKPERVSGVELAPNETMCANCGHRVYERTSDLPA
jgi:hypothetical protein